MESFIHKSMLKCPLHPISTRVRTLTPGRMLGIVREELDLDIYVGFSRDIISPNSVNEARRWLVSRVGLSMRDDVCFVKRLAYAVDRTSTSSGWVRGWKGLGGS